MGNSAVHELDRLPREELRRAIEILELTLESLYEITPKAEELRRRKNVRRRRAQRGTGAHLTNACTWPLLELSSPLRTCILWDTLEP